MNRHRSLAYKACTLACTLVCLLGALTAMAQDTDPEIKKASLRLWPEYDDPGLLVIFAGDFAAGAGFPRDIDFPLPGGARNVQAAYPDASGGLLNADFAISEGRLTYQQLPVPSFHIEYYVDRQPSGNQREIVYAFQAPFAVETLEVAVQQPARATAFSVNPPAGSSETRADGLTYYTFDRANLAAGDTLEITLRYVKTDSGVSSPQLALTNTALTPAAPAVPPASSTVARTSAWLPWALIGLGATALAALITYWLLSRRQQLVLSAAGRKVVPPAQAQRSAGPPPTGAGDFCTQCGHRHRADDRFCAQCGAPRRG